MDARTGKKIRLGYLFNQSSGKSIIVAYSHGVLHGPRPGILTLQEAQRTAQALLAADGLLIAPGMVRHLEDLLAGQDRPGMLVQMDYENFDRPYLPYLEGSTVELAAVEDLVAAGAVGMMSYLFIGYNDPEREKLDIQRNARLARACERWGMVLMIEPRSAREGRHPEDNSDRHIMATYCRIAAELGADLVKCIYPGNTEDLQYIVDTCPAPLLVAGGARVDDPEAAYAKARSAMAAGAAGLVFGRSIYEAPDPAQELARFRQIVHGV
jgi:fructose-bisphosphate aldolase, class I